MRKIVTKLIRSVGIAATAVPLLVTNIPNALADSGYLMPTGDTTTVQFNVAGATSHYDAVNDASGCNADTDYIYAVNGTGYSIDYDDKYYTNLSSIPNGTSMTGIRITPCAGKWGGTNPGRIHLWATVDGCTTGAQEWILSSTSITTLTEKTFTGGGCWPVTKGAGTKVNIGVHYDNTDPSFDGGAIVSRIRYRMVY